jgi:hypothetical protein
MLPAADEKPVEPPNEPEDPLPNDEPPKGVPEELPNEEPPPPPKEDPGEAPNKPPPPSPPPNPNELLLYDVETGLRLGAEGRR